MKKPDGGLRAKFQSNLKRCQFTPIESYVSRGVPDCHILFDNGADVWVEFKRRGEKLRPAQKGWLKRRSFLGGRAFIVEGDRLSVSIYQGGDVDMAKPIFAGGFDWKAIQSILQGKNVVE